MGSFENKCVIVTGGAAGFGEAICRKFAGQGASVVVADLNLEGAQAVAGSLPSAIAIQVDVADEEANKAMAQAAVDAFGKIDVVCCNAGIPHRGNYMIKMEVDEFDRMWAVNVRSIFLAAKHCSPHMPPGSSIVNTASIGGKRPRPGLTPYNASKAAVNTLTRGMAVEMAPNIRVNAVCPVSAPTGFDMTALGVKDLPEDQNKAVIAGIPMGRRATPEDVANSVFFLASDDAEFLTGVCLDVDGGRSIQ
ncbi:MAG: SDR family oxidoreductase [Pseudomonadales bacterium]|nr:SDR family oxidoreductase [Pseudomonadales bacterium]MBO6701348.1 SDR family oxidoreductase [Pseudomonadales bacterium]MBO7007978.1 SDR family oxidoreductase [Pseudomonadales bacterium]